MIDNRVTLHERTERLAQFRARVAVVFERLPMLSGFHVTDDLSVTEVTVQGWWGVNATPELTSAICTELEELVLDDSADTAEMLRGRTFARSLH